MGEPLAKQRLWIKNIAKSSGRSNALMKTWFFPELQFLSLVHTDVKRDLVFRFTLSFLSFSPTFVLEDHLEWATLKNHPCFFCLMWCSIEAQILVLGFRIFSNPHTWNFSPVLQSCPLLKRCFQFPLIIWFYLLIEHFISLRFSSVIFFLIYLAIL